MLLSPAVKVSGVKWIRVQGEPLVQIDYFQTARHANQSGTWISTLTLSPADSWALRSFTRTLGGGSRRISQRGDLQYSNGPDGIPQVQAIYFQTNEGSRIVRRETVTVGEIDFGAPDDDYFGSFTF
jgi:hypothetical protein